MALRFGLANAKNKVAMEAETQIDILGEIANLDPDFDDLVERCCEWVERDVVQYENDWWSDDSTRRQSHDRIVLLWVTD